MPHGGWADATRITGDVLRVPSALTLDHLRRYAIARSLFNPTTLGRAIAKLGFVQMDPIRAPARAQDLTLRHRVDDDRAGQLEARYPRLGVEEDVFVNDGILPRATQRLMHPRKARTEWPRERWAQAVLAFVQSRGVVHPREVDAAFQHGTAKNWPGATAGSARSSWTACTTAAWCAWRAARAVCGWTRRSSPTSVTARRTLTHTWPP